MTTYGFTVTLSPAATADDSERIADVLYGGRCDDCAVHTDGPTVMVSFDRDADSFAAAVASALNDLRTEKLEVARIEIDREDFAPLLADVSIERTTGGRPAASAPAASAPADPALAAAA